MLKEKIFQDLNAAMLGKKEVKEGKSSSLSFVVDARELEISVLRQLLAAILNKEKEKRYSVFKEKSEGKSKSSSEEDKPSSPAFSAAVRVTDEEVMEVISYEAKKRKESISEFEKGGRKDLVEKEKAELEILEKYLPEQLSEEQIKSLVREAISKTGAEEIREMGRIMQELMPKIKGRADGALVSKIVKEALSS